MEVIWFGGALNYKGDCPGTNSWVHWLHSVLSKVGSSANKIWVQTYIAFTCWYIWKARCDFVFNQVPINPISVLSALSSALGSFLLAVEESGSGSSRVGPQTVLASRWRPLLPPFVKLNVDASWSLASRSGFAGMVARNADGSFLAAARYSLRASSSSMAEAMALLCGCELGASLGVGNIILESDSREAISSLDGSLLSGSWEVFPLLARVKRLSGSFQNCRWSWVPRSANGAADALASAGITEMCDIVWVNRPPSSLVHVLCNPCPH